MKKSPGYKVKPSEKRRFRCQMRTIEKESGRESKIRMGEKLFFQNNMKLHFN